MSSPVLWGPNNIANNLQNQELLASGALLAYNGSKNYITYCNFENNLTTGWSLGTVGTLTNGLPTGSPTFGSGASGNLSIVTTSTANIEGLYSLQYISSAATTQGNMVASQSYAIDTEDQAKVLTVKFYYQVTSGASNCNFSGTSSNSFAWAIYDVTNSVWLTSAGNFNLVQSSGCGYVTGTCQTNATTANIRLVVYNANATSGAATLTLDGFYVGPQTAPSGPAMTDWQSYTPTFSAGFGTTSSPAFYYKREGDTLKVHGNFTTGTNAASAARVSIPSGLTIDTTKIAASAGQSCGIWTTNGATSTTGVPENAIAFVASGQTTNISIANVYASSSTNNLTEMNGSTLFNNASNVSVYFEVPISGWSSNTSMSSDTDTRTVAYIGNNVTQGSVTAANAPTTILNFTTTVKDTHGAMSSGTYTVPVTGQYLVQSNVYINLASGSWTIGIYKNGSLEANGYYILSASAISSGLVTSMLNCNAGDTITIRPVVASGSTTATIGDSSATADQLQIFRLSGPAVVTATETVCARYHASTTSISGSLAAITYSTKDVDTHNAYSSGTYTIPTSGDYQINAAAQVSGTFSLNTQTIIQIYRNGSAISGDQNYAGGAETDVFVQINDIYPCNAGDTIQVYLSSGATGAAIVSSNIYNVFSIAKTGKGS